MEPGPDLDKKKPEARQDLPQIVPGAAEEGVHGVTCDALEVIPPELAVALHMADGRLDGAAPPQLAFELLRQLACAAEIDRNDPVKSCSE